MKKFSIQRIRETALLRADGYFEAVMQCGKVEGDHIELTDDQFTKIRARFSVDDKKWPLWALMIAKAKVQADRGVGDTVARMIVGGDSFKTWFQVRFGQSCGCSERQETLNEKYPY